MREKKWLEELLNALDGHTAASLTEAEKALSQGFQPFEEFITEVNQEVVQQNNKEQQD